MEREMQSNARSTPLQSPPLFQPQHSASPSSYRYFHRLHGEITWRLHGLGSRGVPESGEGGKGTKAHECVRWNSSDILPKVHQVWHSEIPQQLVSLHDLGRVVLYVEFCQERKNHAFLSGPTSSPEPPWPVITPSHRMTHPGVKSTDWPLSWLAGSVC